MSGGAKARPARPSSIRAGLGFLLYLKLGIAHARRHFARSGLAAAGATLLSTLSDLLAVARENFAWIMVILAGTLLCTFIWWRLRQGTVLRDSGEPLEAACEHWTCAVPVPVALVALFAGVLWMLRESAADGADHSVIAAQLRELRGEIAAIRQDTSRTVTIVEETLGPDTLVKNPRTAADFLRNARILQERGDIQGAFAALERHVELTAPVQFDVAEVYATHLASRIGTAAALDRLEKLSARGNQPALEVRRALMEPDQRKRVQLLEESVLRHADYGPAHLALAEQLVFVGSRESRAAAERGFRSFLDARGNAEHFADAGRLQASVTQARAMLASLEASRAMEEVSLPRFDVRFVLSNPAVPELKAFVTVGELMKRFRVLIDGKVVQEGTGMRMEPVTVPMNAREVAVEYLDVGGRWQGPLRQPVDPIHEVRAQSRVLLERFDRSNPWFQLAVRSMGGIRGADGRPAQFVSGGFRLTPAHSLAVRRVHFGFDREVPNQSVEIGVPDEALARHAVDLEAYQSRLPRTFPPELQSVSVQLEYFDGTRSPVRKYKVQRGT